MDAQTIHDTLDAARRARREGRSADAQRLFGSIIDGAGEHPAALNGLGLSVLADGDASAAASLFERAIASDPASPELHVNLARAHRERGDTAAERAALDGALSLDQRHFMALVRLAELLERCGDLGGAAERWSGVLALAALDDQRPPELEAMLEHARSTIARARSDFAAVLDKGLADMRDAVPLSERRRFEASMDYVLGRRRIYANDCSGLHFPFLPADEFFDRGHFPWLEEIEAATDTIRDELEALLAEDNNGIRPYVAMDPGTPTNKWSGLDHSLAWGALHLWKDGVRIADACARAPKTAAAVGALPLSDLPGRTPTVFFSLLKPGTHLPAHAGVSNVRATVHLPLIVPANCAFRVGGETREWRVGEAFAFDDTIEHEAWNNSAELRAVLIFDVWNPYLSATERDLLRTFYRVANASTHAKDAAVGIG